MTEIIDNEQLIMKLNFIVHYTLSIIH